MTKVALRGIAARKLRAFTTWLAIFLGVALVSGTYILTDTINESFGEIFSESLKGTDVAITAKTDIASDDTGPPAFDASLLPRVREVDGVESAAGSVFSIGKFVKANGDALTDSFAPNFISSLLPPRFETLDYVEGRKPRTASEASIDTQTADNGGLEIGDRLRVAGAKEVKAYDIVGLTQLGDSNFGGAGIAQMTLPEAQRVTDRVGKFDQISVAAAEGVSAAELRDRIARVLPPNLIAETGQQAAQRQSDDIASDLGFLRIALLVFAGISLFVGAFQIFNTFSITVAQRTREFGMLRTLGASRGQILSSVGIEALVLGLLGAVGGLAAGILFAGGINALFKAIGADLPNTGTVVLARTVIVSLLIGVVVTLVAALAPALRATRITPMAALRESELQDSKPRGRLTLIAALLLGGLGLALMLIGLFGGIEESGTAAGLLGGGAALILFATSLFSPRLVRPLASLAGKPMERIRGLTGRLARENAMRKPGRTATTAAALMIGLALVTFVTVFAAGLKSSIANTIDENFKSDVILQNTDGFSPIPRDAVAAASDVDGVANISAVTYGSGEYKGEQIRVAGIDPETINGVLSLDFVEGSPAVLRGLNDREAVADEAWADSKGLEVGDTVSVRTPLEKRADLHDPRRDRGRSRPVRQDARQRRDAPTAVRRRPAEPRLRAARARSVRRSGPERSGGGARRQVSHRRGAEPGAAEGEPGVAGERAAAARLRAPVAGRDRLPVRDRQHARAFDPRAHARARHAARRRDVAPSGAHDGPLRGRDHGADRSHPRDGAGCADGGARVAAARRRGLHALLPDRHADPAAGAGRTGGRRGCHRPGAAGVADRRPARARVRVGSAA